MSIDFLKDAIYSSFFESDLLDYAIIIIILICAAITDVSIAIGAGLILAFFLFIYKSSKSPYILLSGDFVDMPTNVIRTHKMNLKLRKSKETAYLFQLCGFIFFGASHHITYKIDKKLLKKNGTEENNFKEIKYIIMDYSKITGLDTSAFIALAEWTENKVKHGYIVCSVFVTEEYRNKMDKLLLQRFGNEEKEKYFVLLYNI